MILEPLQLEERNDGLENKWPRLIFYFFPFKRKKKTCIEPLIKLLRKGCHFFG